MFHMIAEYFYAYILFQKLIFPVHQELLGPLVLFLTNFILKLELL